MSESERIVADGGKRPDFLKLAFAAIREKEIRNGVVADKEVHPPIVVDVGGNHAPSFPGPAGDARFAAEVGEGAVTVVMKEPVGHGLVDGGAWLPPTSNGFVELCELQNEKIEAAVVVVIEPDGARAPAGSGDSGFGGDIGESAITIVVVENTLSVLREVKVRKAIVVVIADGYTHAVGIPRDAGFFGDVGESAIAVVAVERVPQRMRRCVEVTLTAVDEVDVHPAVVIVVDEGAACAVRFGQIH